MAKNIFETVAVAKPPRNKFDLSHEKKLTIPMGKLIPIYVEHLVPGEKFRGSHEIFMRANPMLAPIMHRVNVMTETYAIPYRLLWDEFPDWITGGEDGLQNPVHPKLRITEANAGVFSEGSLQDYLGLPVLNPDAGWPGSLGISALEHRAYQLVWNEYYRDENLQAKLNISKASGDVDAGQFSMLTTLRSRAWEKDYFTSALPWAQRGSPVITPLNGSGTVVYDDYSTIKNSDGSPVALNGNVTNVGSAIWTADSVPGRIENIDSVELTSAGITINDLRVAVRLQEWLERAARGGVRLIEFIKSMFGVTSSDARLQRPEPIGSSRAPIVISEVLQTSETATSPQGNMAGHGYAAKDGPGWTYTSEEHCIIITLLSVLPRTAYQQQFQRKWFKFDKYDLLWPMFAQLGEQEVMNTELYVDPDAPNGDTTGVFGYQSRYAEYKYTPSTVHGKMRDQYAFWHMGRIFSSQPNLDETFITADPTTRIFPVSEETHQLILEVYNRIHALRPLPYHNIPTI